MTKHERVLETLRRKRAQAESLWDEKVKAIRENPNQMNIRGVWQASALADLVRAHAIFSALDMAVTVAERECQPTKRGEKASEER